MAVVTERAVTTPPHSPLPKKAAQYLSIVAFAERVGAHPNTVRRMVSKGDIPHTLLDLETEEVLAQESPRPRRFQYLLDPKAVQQVAHQLNPPGSPSGKQHSQADQQTTLEASPEGLTEVWQLRAENRQLRAENDILREYNDRLNTITDRLLPLLPEGAIEGGRQGARQTRRPWYKRLWPRTRGGEQ